MASKNLAETLREKKLAALQQTAMRWGVPCSERRSKAVLVPALIRRLEEEPTLRGGTNRGRPGRAMISMSSTIWTRVISSAGASVRSPRTFPRRAWRRRDGFSRSTALPTGRRWRGWMTEIETRPARSAPHKPCRLWYNNGSF